jgi:hypothetical protein
MAFKKREAVLRVAARRAEALGLKGVIATIAPDLPKLLSGGRLEMPPDEETEYPAPRSREHSSPSSWNR